MEITKVRTWTGQVVRRVDLADMEGVEFRQYSNSRHACQPFAVLVTWDIPLRPGQRPSSVDVKGARILKSGALGDTSAKSYWNSDEWPDWLTAAVEISRPSLAELAVQ